MTLTKRCEFCMRVSSVLDNPYLYSGQVLAKLSVNIATGIWAAIVLMKRDALILWPGFDAVMGFLNEDWSAVGILVMTFLTSLRLINKSSPVLVGACAYGAYLLLWLYTWISLLFAIQSGLTVMRPGQLGAITVFTFLAFFAFVANPKKSTHGSPAD